MRNKSCTGCGDLLAMAGNMLHKAAPMAVESYQVRATLHVSHIAKRITQSLVLTSLSELDPNQQLDQF